VPAVCATDFDQSARATARRLVVRGIDVRRWLVEDRRTAGEHAARQSRSSTAGSMNLSSDQALRRVQDRHFDEDMLVIVGAEDPAAVVERLPQRLKLRAKRCRAREADASRRPRPAGPRRKAATIGASQLFLVESRAEREARSRRLSPARYRCSAPSSSRTRSGYLENSRAVLVSNVNGSIAGAVVDDEELECETTRLGMQYVEAAAEERAFVQRSDDDADDSRGGRTQVGASLIGRRRLQPVMDAPSPT
jgi:hypothetical protein